MWACSLATPPLSFQLESGIGDDRPPAMGTEDCKGERASIVRLGLLLIRKRTWVIRDTPCRPGLELRHLPSGITEGRPAGEERFPLVVAVSRTVALAESGIGDDRPPAMGTEDYKGERASIVLRGLLLIRKRAWVMREGRSVQTWTRVTSAPFGDHGGPARRRRAISVGYFCVSDRCACELRSVSPTCLARALL